MSMSSKVIALAIAVGIATASLLVIAAVKVRTQVDKAFDVAQARTWGWNPTGAGSVVLARTQHDDPADVKGRAEPVIMEIVGAEMGRKGFEPSPDTPDLTLTYYLLLTVGVSAQTLGQFLPSVTEWGLPPFAPATTSFEVIERGSLVLDISANGQLVWRGVAEARLEADFDRPQRTALLRDAVDKIMRRVPRRAQKL